MSIGLMFLSLVIPIKKFDEIESFDDFLNKNTDYIGKSFWYDQCLFRQGAMSLDDIDFLISEWKERGLSPTKMKDDVEIYDALCILDSGDGPMLNCDWIDYQNGKVSYIKDTFNKVVIYNASPNEDDSNYSIIKGQYQNDSVKIKKGAVTFDDNEVCFNFKTDGSYEFIIANEYIEEMNKLSEEHTLNLYDFNTGDSFNKPFILKKSSEIIVNIK